MYTSHGPRCTARPAACLKVDDLNAHLATLDRFGPIDLGAIVGEGLRKLVVLSKTAICRDTSTQAEDLLGRGVG